MVSRALVVSLLLLFGCTSVFAEEAKAARLADLMKQPTYRAAWIGMLADVAARPWLEDYAKTLDGPATPAIPVPIGTDSYTLGFTCKPNGCGDDQLYVLFSPGGAKAWGLLLAGKERKWLGSPDQAIQDAILGVLE
jgi:hypothetical protein